MHKVNFKSIVLLLGLMLPAAWCGAHGTCSSDGLSHIQVKEAVVFQPVCPKSVDFKDAVQS